MLRCFKIILTFSLIAYVTPNLIFAQEHTHSHPDAVTTATPQLQPGEVVITGNIICLGCHLKQEKQAKAQCSIYGHANAIIIEKAINSEGQPVAGAAGKIYQFLHNDHSDKLITEHSYEGKTVIITGKIYTEANIIEVNYFRDKRGEEK